MTGESSGKRLSSFRDKLGHLFLHYGAGHSIFTPLLKSNFWAWFSWIVIALGIIGWITLLIYIDPARD